MMDLSITDEELNALKMYLDNKYEAINQMLNSNCETDIALLSDEIENKVVAIAYDRESIKEYLKNIKLIYSLVLKKYYSNPSEITKKVFRGTNLFEIELFSNEMFIDRFWTATENENTAINTYSYNWENPVCANIELAENIPFINLEEVLNDENYKDDILIAAFTKIINISEVESKTIEENSKLVKSYDIKLEKQELETLEEFDKYGLYNHILDSSYSIKRKIQECIELEKENSINFENIRKLEQLLGKYEKSIEDKKSINGYFSMEVEADYDDIARISRELEILKNTSANMYEIRNENINFINMWKRNIAVFLMAECREIEDKIFETLDEIRENQKIEKSIEQAEEQHEAENDINQNIETVQEEKVEGLNIETNLEENREPSNEETILKENIEASNEEIIPEENIEASNEEEDTLGFRVRVECKENIEMCEKLLSDIKDLITKQQNHAKIAGNMGATYSSLNNAFDMRKSAESLLDLLKNIDLKVKVICEEEKEENKEKLEKISKTNIEIGTLINYLNNPKIVTKNTNATRFDEMAIIEENELKKGISERIRNIRGEAELKKLKDDLEILEEKGAISKFFGIFTGKNKFDQFMIDQIEVRQRAIRKTLSQKLTLAHNYSIHELMAEITMFINENEDDELVEDDVTDFKAIAEELKRNFVILNTKVQSIIEEKEGRNIPVQNKKLSKKEIIEIETYRFLNKYGYDIQTNEKEEPKYQDTMASEIGRIIEYINSSKIL